MLKETIVFIDGEYLSLVSKRLLGSDKPAYDLQRFAFNLAKEQNLWCKRVFYYTAPPYQSKKTTKQEDDRKSRYDKFISRLVRRGFIVREGRCQKTGDSFRQKGVDTLLTMDLLEMPLSEGVTTLILVTGDTDFVPVLDRIRSKHGVKVALYYYSDRVRDSRFSMSNHLINACDKRVALSKAHFEGCEFPA